MIGRVTVTVPRAQDGGATVPPETVIRIGPEQVRAGRPFHAAECAVEIDSALRGSLSGAVYDALLRTMLYHRASELVVPAATLDDEQNTGWPPRATSVVDSDESPPTEAWRRECTHVNCGSTCTADAG